MKSDLEELQVKLLEFAHIGDLEKTAKTLLKLGEIYQEHGMEDHAIESYENAKKLYNKCKNIKGEAQSILNIGQIYDKRGEYEKAQKMYKEAAEKFKELNDTKNQATAIYHHARILEKQGNFEDAFKVYHKYHKLCTLMDDNRKMLVSYAKIKSMEEYSSQEHLSYKDRSRLSLIGYPIFILFAEILTAYINVLTGLGIHVLILFVLLAHSSLVSNEKFKKVLNSMTILPLIRIVSFSIPVMDGIPEIYRLLIVSLPLFALAYVLMKTQKLEGKDVGLIWKKPNLQLLVALTGFPIGYIEFMILYPKPFIPMSTFLYLLIGFLILILVGFSEELLFRGILQKNSEKLLGVLPGLLYASLLFTICHVGWGSIYELIFVFFIAIFYGYMYQKTGSIIGVTFSHALSNFMLFLFMPFHLAAL
ncbi:MAG: CPBP family glutamic-type intramembrane protease [Methanothermobacter sp.]|nr:CPBP family glutamic-type intramembrane protease [Methanothermobacter sp.]